MFKLPRPASFRNSSNLGYLWLERGGGRVLKRVRNLFAGRFFYARTTAGPPRLSKPAIPNYRVGESRAAVKINPIA